MEEKLFSFNSKYVLSDSLTEFFDVELKVQIGDLPIGTKFGLAVIDLQDCKLSFFHRKEDVDKPIKEDNAVVYRIAYWVGERYR